MGANIEQPSDAGAGTVVDDGIIAESPDAVLELLRTTPGLGVIDAPRAPIRRKATKQYNLANRCDGPLPADMLIITAPKFVNRRGDSAWTEIKTFYAVGVLTRLRLLTSGGANLNWIPFEYGNHCYVVVSVAALNARRAVVRNVTGDTIKDMRKRSISTRRRVQMLRELYAAGIHVCPASGLPVFDPDAAPESLFDLFKHLRLAVDGDAGALEAAATAAHALSDAFDVRIAEGARPPELAGARD